MTQLKNNVAANDVDVRVWHDIHYAHTTPETRPNAWRRFLNFHDPYNTDNFITGYVQMIGGHEYGDLIIEEVNERPAFQRISTTPKTAYPYRRDRAWLLNSAEWIRSARKLDGTNICQYSYEDADGQRFTTYKLRTRPFVSAYFRVLLDRTLKKYPVVANLQVESGECMIYELYGRQNPLLIIYKEDIELAALCRVNPVTGDIDPADASDPAFSRLDCPLAEASVPSHWDNIRDEYVRRQLEYSSHLVEVEQQGERAFHGHEGEMLYVHFADGARSEPGAFTRLIKLKPPEIEEIHQASDHVPKEELEATIRNIFEVDDEPELVHFLAMLAEDWDEKQIERSMETIERVFDAAIAKRKEEDEVLAVFNREFTSEQFRADKAVVMRRMAQEYPKAMIGRVFGILDARLP